MSTSLTISKISESSGLSRKTVYKVLRGRASEASALKVCKAINSLTAKKITVNELRMGEFSSSLLVRQLVKKHVRKLVNKLETTWDTCNTARVSVSGDDVFCGSADDLHILL